MSSSEESFENLLYYQDCGRKAMPPVSTTPPRPVALRGPPRQPECPFPKMCCSMTCDNECQVSPSHLGRLQMNQRNIQETQPNSFAFPPVQPPVQPQLRKGRNKKKSFMHLPIDGRRNIGFTKDKIKSLISQDGDIKKILKDLVRVTMQKVDLMDMINDRKSMNKENVEATYEDEGSNFVIEEQE